MRDVAWICGIWADGALLQLYDPRFNLRRSTSSTISRVRRPRSTLVAVLSVGCGDRVGDLAVWERYGWFMAMSKVGRSRWLSWFISHIVSIVNHSYWSLFKQLSYRLRAPHCSLSFQHSLHHIHNIYQHVRLVDLGTSVFFALDRMHRQNHAWFYLKVHIFICISRYGAEVVSDSVASFAPFVRHAGANPAEGGSTTGF